MTKKRIHWPATEIELGQAGYTWDGGSKPCTGRTCNAHIEWWKTPAGKPMPMHRLADGTLQPHWADCPDAKTFRR